MTTKQALFHIVNNRNEKSLNYAINYAKAGLDMEGHKLDMQIPYVLCNMKGWRGKLAKEVREALKNHRRIR